MKKNTFIIFTLIIFMFTACTNGKEVDGHIEEINANAEHVLDGINVYDLFQMNLGEVIDLLGPNHTEPFYYAGGAPHIKYEGSCMFRYMEKIEVDANGVPKTEIGDEPTIGIEDEIVAITIYQQLDVYKGISAGRTLDEINSSPDLLNELVARVDEENYNTVVNGFFDCNGAFFGMELTFDDDMVCTAVFLVAAEDLRGDPIIEDKLL